MIKRIHVEPVSSLYVSASNVPVVAFMVWVGFHHSVHASWAGVAAALVLGIGALQFSRVLPVYRLAVLSLSTSRDPVLKETLNMLVSAFQWGNIFALLIASVVLLIEQK